MQSCIQDFAVGSQTVCNDRELNTTKILPRDMCNRDATRTLCNRCKAILVQLPPSDCCTSKRGSWRAVLTLVSRYLNIPMGSLRSLGRAGRMFSLMLLETEVYFRNRVPGSSTMFW